MKIQAWKMLALVLLLAIVTACGNNAGSNGAGNGNSQATPNGQQEGNSQQEGNGEQSPNELRKVQLMLDYTPNTNHTGIYVARDLGYFAEQGLEVEIIAPADGGADAHVAAGNVEFGVSYQENVTLSRIAGLPVVSLAAVIQHNTSGFASPKDKGIETPKQFEGMRYGGWGSPIEQATIESLMLAADADYDKMEIINMGNSDFFAAIERDIDFAWIFYAWTGIEAELRGVDLNMIYMKDYNENLDYYTPVLVTSESLIAEDPELVRSFVAAVAKGYQYSIEQPEQAAEVLIAAEPDLNPELVKASQQWLSPRYQDDAPRWGEQKLSVWEGYADWMFSNGLLEGELEAEKAFTNEFLPR
ncbi:nitrate ABC transporter substrate-binding protein [Paenibacillus montaniterrae]|uniref:Nitrate ABC transporter substrate-binding protein n=1 Tax=Paenibacillus montaniterrae TaxID=429341 RepID=A0A920CVT5_9BACL|nr:ABC transporter substrate-binding protein [Paenibacillus montaniterrae]GIP14495.1 nitrate ABC transporter substrate-binding protein [Paenibacillus montaniterrae]